MNSIKLIVYDFDGVMTDNKVYIDQNGNEMVQVNRADGLGVSLIKKLGIPQIILSTEVNPVVSARARKLDLPCRQGIKNKEKELRKFCKENNYDLELVGYVGNDINDLGCLQRSGCGVVVADAHESVRSSANMILSCDGGNNAVRELIDLILPTI